MWNKMLTEIDGDYLELMVGAFSDNQPGYSWIAPGETKTFKQYWYPAIKMGGIKAANKNVALNIERIATDKRNYGVRKADVSIIEGEIHLQMEPYSLYSLGNNLNPIPSVIIKQ